MDTNTQIQDLLNNIERENKVRIILAVESGSRVWGFPSKDSDFDIRFIYQHPRDWYISAFQKRDVIDNIFEGELDAGGWDIGKCLRLMQKGNGALLEWLHAPIIYKQDEQKAIVLRKLAQESFNPLGIFHHYLSLAERKLEDDKTRINAKSFLYALRALLCAKWIADSRTIPPVTFETLWRKLTLEEKLDDQLFNLLEEKLLLEERDHYAIPDELFGFARDIHSQLTSKTVPASEPITLERYDQVLRESLQT